MHRKRGVVGVGVCACVLAIGCGRGAGAESLTQERAKGGKSGALEKPVGSGPKAMPVGLVIGEFSLAADPIVDGDTIRVEGVDGTIRLLSIDTEEKVRSKRDRDAIEIDFEAYLERKRAGSPRPIKAATPMGDRATEFARAFFEGTETVRLERDDAEAMHGRYGRVLAYAFVKKDGRWTSYNVEAVRAGMTPYFTKYGYSQRFHTQFARAEREARSARRGIWNPDARGYKDYAERKEWWGARADFIQAFEHAAAGREDYIVLARANADARLADRLGTEATVLGDVDEIRRFKRLTRVRLAGPSGRVFPIIFRDRDVLRRSELERYLREPVTIRGKIERYERGDYETPQIVVSDPSQVGLPSIPQPQHATR